MRQTGMVGNVVGNGDTRIELFVIYKSPAVYPDLHALHWLLQWNDRKCIFVTRLDIIKA